MQSGIASLYRQEKRMGSDRMAGQFTIAAAFVRSRCVRIARMRSRIVRSLKSSFPFVWFWLYSAAVQEQRKKKQQEKKIVHWTSFISAPWAMCGVFARAKLLIMHGACVLNTFNCNSLDYDAFMLIDWNLNSRHSSFIYLFIIYCMRHSMCLYGRSNANNGIFHRCKSADGTSQLTNDA